MTDSLIQADKQLPLFGSDQMDPALFSDQESGPRPEFTGARLFAHNPDIYRAVVALSAEGLGAIRIGRILHVSPNTVLAVREREPQSIDIEKRRLASLSSAGARMCVEGIIEMLSDPKQVAKMTIKDQGIVFGILAEKAELLSGSPTARLQTVGAPPVVKVVEYLHWLRSEHARRMGLATGKDGQREAAGSALGSDQRALGPAPAGVDPDLGPDEGGALGPAPAGVDPDLGPDEGGALGPAPAGVDPAADLGPAPAARVRQAIEAEAAETSAPASGGDAGAHASRPAGVGPGPSCEAGQAPHCQDRSPVNTGPKEPIKTEDDSAEQAD